MDVELKDYLDGKFAQVDEKSTTLEQCIDGKPPLSSASTTNSPLSPSTFSTGWTPDSLIWNRSSTPTAPPKGSMTLPPALPPLLRALTPRRHNPIHAHKRFECMPQPCRDARGRHSRSRHAERIEIRLHDIREVDAKHGPIRSYPCKAP